MSYSIRFSGADDSPDDDTFFLCSVGSWSKFCEWANGLEAGFYAVKALATRGKVMDTEKLSAQLKEALMDGLEHTEEHVARGVAEDLLEHLGVGEESETAEIVDA